ncbi:MAG: hypothetical protein H5T45_05855 [Thermoplasmatales archaeon]|nr:hypothetical protein [Thermoplasmatales archaeon]
MRYGGDKIDNKGRVPFSLLGVFLLIGAIFTSSIVSNLQREYSLKHAETIEASSMKYAILNFEQELVRILRYSTLEAMKIVGSNPVFYLPKDGDEINYTLAKRYAGEENPFFDTLDRTKIMNYNKNWTRDLIKNKFNGYLEVIFKNDRYRIGNYAINVIDLPSYENIRLEDIKMKLNRSIEFLGIKDKEYTVYWKAVVNGIRIEIHDLERDMKYEKDLEISSLIPSRLPLLMELVIDYEDSINGEFKPLMTFVTSLGMGVTEIRALLQYGAEDIENIVSNNCSLIPITNLGLIVNQFLIFNSADIVSTFKTSSSLGKIFLDDAPSSTIEFSEEDLLGKDFEFDFKEIYRNGTKKLKDCKSEQGNPVLKIAEDLLYERNYEYLNTSYNEKIIKDEYKDYEIEENGKEYVLSGFFLNKNKVNSFTLENISRIINNIYRVSFKAEKKVIEFNERYGGNKKGNLVWWGEWEKVYERWENKIQPDILPSLPHEETVEFEFKRYEEYVYQEGNQTITSTVTHYISGKFSFRINKPDIRDIEDVFHSKILNCRDAFHEDDNLETGLKLFVNEFIDFRESCMENLNGNYESSVKTYELADMVDVAWVKIEAFKELEEILGLIKEDEEIYKSKMLENSDATNLPNLGSIEEERRFLLEKFRENKEKYQSFTDNYYKESNLYKSAGAKAISETGRWYLNRIEEELNKSLSWEKELDKKIEKYGFEYEKIEGLKVDFSSINIGIFDMKIEGEWNESISIAVDCDPDYQDKNFTNICIFPTGFPVLPTPVTPWVVTINVWYINVNGSFNLTLKDSNESIANQLFGYESQVLKRKDGKVIDPLSNTTIGYNKNVTFSFATLFFAVTPPKMPIADFAPLPCSSCPYCPIVEEKNE